jgi:tetratricopeptide (TPR) repeat protein
MKEIISGLGKPFLAMLLATFTASYCSAQDEASLETLLSEGDALLSEERDDLEARRYYHMAITQHPESAIAHHKLGRSFLGDYFKDDSKKSYLDSAVIYERKARLLDPQYIDAYYNEVMAYRQTWKHGMSRMALMDALKHNPNNAEILMLTGRNYFDTGNPGLALPYLERSMEMEDTPEVAYRFAGWCWFYLEDHEKQLAYFNQFRELNPKSLMGIAGQVHSYTGMKEYDQAITLAKQIREENPDYTYPAYLVAYIGETLLFAERYDEAMEYYKEAYAMNPEVQNLFATRAVTTTLGYLYFIDGEKEKAEKLLQKTIERRTVDWEKMPERWEFSFDIASAYAVMGDKENAFQWLYTSVITGYPGHLWLDDPIFESFHNDFAFQQLVNQARIRVIGEYDE